MLNRHSWCIGNSEAVKQCIWIRDNCDIISTGPGDDLYQHNPDSKWLIQLWRLDHLYKYLVTKYLNILTPSTPFMISIALFTVVSRLLPYF